MSESSFDCPKVCHDEAVCRKNKCGKCKAGCKRNSDCDGCEKSKYLKEVRRPCELPCKVKDQIKFLKVEGRMHNNGCYGCPPVIYDPVKMVQKCHYVCCNTNCQDCKDCMSSDKCPGCKCESSSSSSESSVECLCKVVKQPKCESSSSSESSDESSCSDDKKHKHRKAKGGCKTCAH
jgi:hypothetical protein